MRGFPNFYRLVADMKFDYDYIIAGGGCAGMSLAWRLAQDSRHQSKVLIIDAGHLEKATKTWCYWAKGQPEYQSASQVSWSEMAFYSNSVNKEESLHPLRYYHVRSQDFLAETREKVFSNPNFTFCPARIESIEDLDHGAQVKTDQGSFTARYVFSSLLPSISKDPERHIYLRQHFLGWEVQTDRPVFNPSRAVMMDFRDLPSTPVQMVYTLPFAADRALVEYTIFSDQLLPKEAYVQALEDWMTQRYPGVQYDIVAKEQGDIPMTNHPLGTDQGPNIWRLGTAAGWTKPSTGYTFNRIQRETARLAERLVAGQSPDLGYSRSKDRFAFYDDLLLHIIKNEPQLVGNIFDHLFKGHSFRKILTFLAEDTNLWQEAGIFARLPWPPFLKALGRYKILGQTSHPSRTWQPDLSQAPV